ncbi:MAG: shikimate kinase [Methanomassiliicoccaceae archaeon]|jgi:shikimate kinase|nr:shikimate kinase [Methanomassiliicoccaceae archaeon]
MISYGAITVVNAIPCGIGAAVGIRLTTNADLTAGGTERVVKIINDPNEDTNMARICVKNTFKRFNVSEPDGWKLTVNSQIPVSRGLKSSSSACNAIVSATADNVVRTHGGNGFGIGKDAELEMIRFGVGCAKEAGVTVTGAFDDACACHLGGLVITDNTNDSLLKHDDVEDNDIILLIPEAKIRKPSLDTEAFRAVSGKAKDIIRTAENDWYAALTDNGRLVARVLGIDDGVASVAIRMGALAAGVSGTGPAIAVVVGKGEGMRFARELDFGGYRAMVTRTRGIS